MDPTLQSSDESEVSSNHRSSFRRSKSKRSQLKEAIWQSASAIEASSPSSPNRKSKSKSESKSKSKSSRRRKSIDNASPAGSRSSSRRTKEKSPPQQKQPRPRRRVSLDSYNPIPNDHRNSTISHDVVGATKPKSDGGDNLEKPEGEGKPPLNQSTHSTSRFSTSTLTRRHSVDSSARPTLTRPPLNQSNSTSRFSTRTLTRRHSVDSSARPILTRPSNNKVASAVVVHTCDEKGRCLFHPHIRLRKKSVGGGWHDLYTKCPDCEKQELKEFLLKEKEEIERLERLLGRMDQHDVEYLNDDGVDDDGNYLKLDESEGGEEEMGNQGVDGKGEKRVVQITFAEGCRLPMTMERRMSSFF